MPYRILRVLFRLFFIDEELTMIINKFKFLLVTTALCLTQAFGASQKQAESFLAFEDIYPVMEQILEYHVDHHEMKPHLMQRAIKLYFKQFDPERIYFLEEEAAPFFQANEQVKEHTLSQYHNNRYETFYQINNEIQKAIQRHRYWRKSLFKDVDMVFEDVQSFEESDVPSPPPFSKSELELKQRIYHHALRFIQSQIGKTSKELAQENQEKILQLYLKKVNDKENLYLSINKDEKHREHLLSLRILKALAKSLDSHTAFFSPAEAYNMRINLEKSFQGIGVVLEETYEGVKVVKLIEGGPADKSGVLKKGDFIVSVEGASIKNLSFREILDLIRGKEGTDISLGIKRYDEEPNANEQFLSVTLTRGKVTLNDQRVETSFERFGDGIIGKITLHSFYEGGDGVSSEKDVLKAIRELSKEGDLNGLILDLRNNSGGFLSQAVRVAGLFITNGVVVVSKYSDGDIRIFRDLDGQTYYDGPVVVLTSKASASAAEIVAQALQDYGTSIIVGDERTYGKGSIQHQTITNENASSHFKVTVGRYYTASGKSTQINGVKADIIVPGKLSDEEIGEQFLEYPLAYDTIGPIFFDPLVDLDSDAKKWFQKYYLPTLQKPQKYWKQLLPQLKKNSSFRVQNSEEYQTLLSSNVSLGDKFLEQDVNSVKSTQEMTLEKLQEQEAVNIVKDMILLQKKHRELSY